MAAWVTHLMIADGVLKRFPNLDRRGFCVGSIAPDCNMENEDWTAFTPSREVTHWMQGERKAASDSDVFCEEYLLKHVSDIPASEQGTSEKYAFLLGYYAHLMTDAAYQAMIRDEERVRAAWRRVQADDELRRASANMEESWGSVRKLISKEERMREMYAVEAEYLRANPDSGYLTEILPLKEFPDYIDYLPHGAIVRKIGVMGYLPEQGDTASNRYIAVSREEYAAFVANTVQLVSEQLIKKHLLSSACDVIYSA